MIYGGVDYRFVATARWAVLLEELGIAFEYDRARNMFTLSAIGLRLVHWIGRVRLPRAADVEREGAPILIAGNVGKAEPRVLAIDADDNDMYVDLPCDPVAFRAAQKTATRAFRGGCRYRFWN